MAREAEQGLTVAAAEQEDKALEAERAAQVARVVDGPAHVILGAGALDGLAGQEVGPGGAAVGWAQEGDSLVPGCVFAAPPGQHTLITKDETIALIPSGPAPPYRPSADLLLTTLAVAAGRRVTAVVLSGEGQDAATGATAVHHFGGTVIVSSMETSARSAMPRATMLRDEITDHVVPLDVAALLLALTTAPLVEPHQ
jgi:hypothetical protein